MPALEDPAAPEVGPAAEAAAATEVPAVAPASTKGEPTTTQEAAPEAQAPPASTAPPERKRKRETCARCARPAVTCLCASLPDAPLPTAGEVILLQHPLEARSKNATVPLIQWCVRQCTVYRARSYHPATHEALRRAVEEAERVPLLFLFPGPESRDAYEVGRELRLAAEAGEGASRRRAGASETASAAAGTEAGAPAVDSAEERAADPAPSYRLLVIDGTWRYGREMATKILPNLPESTVLIEIRAGVPRAGLGEAEAQNEAARTPSSCGESALGGGGGAGVVDLAGTAAAARAVAAATASPADSPTDAPPPVPAPRGSPAAAARPFALMMEPAEGCLTTAEAVARALEALEPTGSPAAPALLAALRATVQLRARWDPATRARLHGLGAAISTSKTKFGVGKALPKAAE